MSILLDGSIQWFNSLHKINVSLTSLQYFVNLPTPTTNLSDNFDWEPTASRVLMSDVNQNIRERGLEEKESFM